MPQPTIDKLNLENQYFRSLPPIFEIGRRLKHVKENDLAHGEFGKWLKSINMNHDTANKMMKIANELSSKSYTYMNLGSRALYEIATLPEEERTKEHTTSISTK
ncbi:DUF3102 domain-containing protein [Staphylococcus equorum]|uniref:DUF3102 domain-containing protein n=1 Tax=Staphylococcus equorum TaxID=246432 RepID=UPI001F3ED408|nr:DUF3102 domain-containing protein [Staphylococcus equorum]